MRKWILQLAVCATVLFGTAAFAQQINLQTQVKGLLAPVNGGTGLNTSGLTGCPQVTSGVWSIVSCATGGGAAAGGNYAIQFSNGGAFGGANFTGFVYNNGSSQPPTAATAANLAGLGTLSNSTTGNAATATAVSGVLGANQVLGALTATVPSGLSVPSCSASNDALTWTSGTGFGCNAFTGLPATSITVGTTTINSGTSGSIEYNNAGVLGERVPTGSGTEVVSSTTATRTSNHLLWWSGAGDATDSGILGSNVALLNGTQTFTGLNTWSQTAQFNSFVNVGNALVVTGATTMQSGFSSNGGSTVSGQLSVSSAFATSGTNLSSPNLVWDGSYYNGGAISDTWAAQDVVGAGTNPTSVLTFTHIPGSGWTGTPSISFPAISSTHVSHTGSITNTAYFQVTTIPNCALTATIGNTCVVTFTLPVTEPDTSYLVTGCQVTNIIAVAANAGTLTTSTFQLQISSIGTATAANVGYITCLVTHP